jgi:hypothetical protein
MSAVTAKTTRGILIDDYALIDLYTASLVSK